MEQMVIFLKKRPSERSCLHEIAYRCPLSRSRLKVVFLMPSTACARGWLAEPGEGFRVAQRAVRGMIFSLLCFMTLLSPPLIAEDLSSLLRSFHSLHATLTETSQETGQAPQISQGEVWISKPNRFRFEIKSPDPAVYVSDGHSLWQYQPDLEQVIRSPLNQELTLNSPLLILSGQVTQLEKLYRVKALGPEQFQLLPKNADHLIQSLRIQFAEGRLSELDIQNQLNQSTHLVFSNLELNPALKDSIFEFIPPPGVDILETDS